MLLQLLHYLNSIGIRVAKNAVNIKWKEKIVSDVGLIGNVLNSKIVLSQKTRNVTYSIASSSVTSIYYIRFTFVTVEEYHLTLFDDINAFLCNIVETKSAIFNIYPFASERGRIYSTAGMFVILWSGWNATVATALRMLQLLDTSRVINGLPRITSRAIFVYTRSAASNGKRPSKF